MSEHQTDWETYTLLPMYAYELQVGRSIEVASFSLALMQTIRGPAIIASAHTNLAKDDDMASPMYALLELLKRATVFLPTARQKVSCGAKAIYE